MADSKSERVLKALHAALSAAVPAGVLVERNASLPVRLPAAGWLCLRDGDPGAPDVLMSPLLYIYEHRAELDIVVEITAPEQRDARFDALKQAVGLALASDRTLGGLCDFILGEAPEPTEVPVEGAENLKAATIGIILTYGTSDPLA